MLLKKEAVLKKLFNNLNNFNHNKVANNKVKTVKIKLQFNSHARHCQSTIYVRQGFKEIFQRSQTFKVNKTKNKKQVYS